MSCIGEHDYFLFSITISMSSNPSIVLTSGLYFNNFFALSIDANECGTSPSIFY